MAASDHLSPAQFFHTSDTAFKPGDVLTREGAWRAKHPELANNPEALRRYKLYSPGGPHEEPSEDHLYYANRGFVESGESTMYGAHTYAVEPLTPAGKPTKSHQEDPNYRDYGRGAYRTRGQLRVLHEVNEHGERV